MKVYIKLIILLISCPFFSNAQKSNSDFVFTIKTDNPGGTNGRSYYLRTHNSDVYDFDVDWNNDGVFEDTNQTGSIFHSYPTAGTYTIRVRGLFPRLNFTIIDNEKLISVDQWGSQIWTSMNSAFFMCHNLKSLPIDTPNLTQVTDMGQMFYKADSLNAEIGFWDVSNVENMGSMFYQAKLFNGDISNWNVTSLRNAHKMFSFATSFNQSLANWDINSVQNMQYAFDYSGISNDKYDTIIIAWSRKSNNYPVIIGAAGKQYCSSIAERQTLINRGWTFVGDSKQAGCLITGVEEKDLTIDEFQVYPNPTKGLLTVKVSELKRSQLFIFNNLGQMVLELKPSIHAVEIDLSDLDDGIYFVKYGNQSQKLIIQR